MGRPWVFLRLGWNKSLDLDTCRCIDTNYFSDPFISALKLNIVRSWESSCSYEHYFINNCVVPENIHSAPQIARFSDGPRSLALTPSPGLISDVERREQA